MLEIPNSEKIIIWTNFIKTAENISKRLKGRSHLLITGEIDVDKRNRVISEFKNDPSKKF